MSTRTSLPVPTFSSPLAAALSRFLAFKRAAGCRYVDEARALRLLDRFLTATLDADDPVITLDVVRQYVARRGEESETTRAHRLSLIRQVCRFLALEQPRTAVPAPRFLAICRRPFVARVMSQEEGRRFLTACEHLVTRPWSPVRDIVLGIQQGYRVCYREAHMLLEEIADATLDGTRKAYFADLATVRLIVDDLGMRKLPHTAAEDPGSRHASLRARVDALDVKPARRRLGQAAGGHRRRDGAPRLLAPSRARPQVRTSELAHQGPDRLGTRRPRSRTSIGLGRPSEMAGFEVSINGGFSAVRGRAAQKVDQTPLGK